MEFSELREFSEVLTALFPKLPKYYSLIILLNL